MSDPFSQFLSGPEREKEKEKVEKVREEPSSPFKEFLSTPRAATGIENPTPVGELFRGFERGFRTTGADLTLLTGALSERLGAEKTARALYKSSFRQREDIPMAAVPSFTDIDSLGDVANFSSAAIGELGSIVAGGGAIGVLAKLGTKGLTRLAVREASERLANRVAVGSVTAAAIGVESGATLGELREATGETHLGPALAAGTVKGALESLVPIAVLSKLGLSGSLAGKYVNKLTETVARNPFVGAGKLAAKGAGVEGLTEIAQESVDIATREFIDENFQLLNEENLIRLADAGIKGAIGGSVINALAGKRRNPQTSLSEADVQAAARDVPQTGATVEDLGRFLGLSEKSGDLVSGLSDLNSPTFDVTLSEAGFNLPSDNFRQVAAVNRVSGRVDVVTGADLNVLAGIIDDPKNLEIREVDASKISRQNRSASLPDLVDFKVEDFYFVGSKAPDKKRIALTLVEEASRDLLAGRIDSASDKYNVALNLGGRVRPVAGRSFTIVEGGEEALGAPVERGREPIDTRLRRTVVGAGLDLRDLQGNIFPAFTTSNLPNSPGSLIVDRQNPTQRYSKEKFETVIDSSLESIRESGIELFDLPHIEQMRVLWRELRRRGFGFNIDRNVRLDRVLFQPPARYSFGLANISKEVGADLGAVPIAPSPISRAKRVDSKAQVVSTGKPLKGQDAKVAEKVKRIVDAWLKRLDIKRQAFVYFVKDPKESFDLIDEGGQTRTLTENTHGVFYTGDTLSNIHIALNLEMLKDTPLGFETAIAETLAHEFGHAVVTTTWRQLPFQVKELIYQDFARSRARFFAAAEDDFLQEVGQQGQIKDVRRYVRGGNLPTRSLDDRYRNYWSSFNEYMARQISLALVTETPATGTIHNYFQKTLEALKASYAEFAKKYPKLGSVGPDFGVRKYISLLEQHNIPDPSIESGFSLRDSKFADLLENAKSQDSKQLPSNITPSSPIQAVADSVAEKVEAILAAENTPAAKSVVKNLKEAQIHSSKLWWLRKYTTQIDQLARNNPRLQELQNYMALMRNMLTDKMGQVNEGDRIAKQWLHLGQEMGDNLSKFIYDIEEMIYLTKEEKKGKVNRHPTAEELLEIAGNNNLSREALFLYRDIRSFFSNFLSKMEDHWIKEASNIIDPKKRAEAISSIKREVQELLSRPYFPMSRFGKFTLTVRRRSKSGKGRGRVELFSVFETEKERDSALKEVLGNFKQEKFTVNAGIVLDSYRPLLQMPPTLLRRLETELLEKAKNAEERSAIEARFEELSYITAPGQSFRKHLIRRRKVRGYSQDAMRAFSNYVTHGSSFLSRTVWGPQMLEQIEALERRTKNTDVRDTDVGSIQALGEIHNFMRQHYEEISNPGNEWAWARGFAYTWHLGWSVASAVLNLTQIPMVAVPYLTTRYGTATTSKMMSTATTDLTRRMTYGRKLNTVEEEALQYAAYTQALDQTSAAHLAGLGESTLITKLMSGDNVQGKVMALSESAGYIFQVTEQANRYITFLTALRSARAQITKSSEEYGRVLETEGSFIEKAMLDNGWDELTAVQFFLAHEATTSTMFNYMREYRPSFMRGKKGVLFTFYTYPLNMLYLVTRDKSWFRMLLAMGFIGGLSGLPGSEELQAILKQLAKRFFGKDFDVEREARRWLVDMFGDDGGLIAEASFNGISRYGFGIAPFVDMSGAVSLGTITPGARGLNVTSADTADSVAGKYLLSLGGAAADPIVQVYRFMMDSQTPMGDPKRWEKLVPRAFRNAMQATRFAEEGRERNRLNATILEFDMTNPMHVAEVAAKGFGFQPRRLSQKYEKTAEMYEVRNYWEGRRENLMRQFYWATQNKDRSKAEVIQRIRKFNIEIKRAGFAGRAINIQRLKSSLENRLRRKQLQQMGGTGQRSDRVFQREVQRLFPEAQE